MHVNTSHPVGGISVHNYSVYNSSRVQSILNETTWEFVAFCAFVLHSCAALSMLPTVKTYLFRTHANKEAAFKRFPREKLYFCLDFFSEFHQPVVQMSNLIATSSLPSLLFYYLLSCRNTALITAAYFSTDLLC